MGGEGDKVKVQSVLAKGKLVLYDGVCAMCCFVVNFIMAWDSSEQIVFASLQSSLGKAVLAHYGLPDDLSTVVFVENGRPTTKSTAILGICARLDLPVSLLSLLLWIPAVVRDFGYDLVGGSRYALFGKYDTCRRPSQAQVSRVLDWDEAR
mmetsp:Transcript_19154/g.53769  ORF Transcript_19154/g.53769 Transcript_19154/m.53769 type:complete len:151 (-) Transcript_19154:164-616(-)